MAKSDENKRVGVSDPTELMYFIPVLSDEELVERATYIRPVRWVDHPNERGRRALRVVALPERFERPHALRTEAFNQFPLSDMMLSSAMAVQDLWMLFEIGGPDRTAAAFHGTMSEVLAQIPESILPAVMGFELIPPALRSMQPGGYFHEQLEAGFHVARVVLYGHARMALAPEPVDLTKVPGVLAAICQLARERVSSDCLVAVRDKTSARAVMWDAMFVRGRKGVTLTWRPNHVWLTAWYEHPTAVLSSDTFPNPDNQQTIDAIVWRLCQMLGA